MEEELANSAKAKAEDDYFDMINDKTPGQNLIDDDVDEIDDDEKSHD